MSKAQNDKPLATVRFRVRGDPKAWQRPRFNRKTQTFYTAPQDRLWRESAWAQAFPSSPRRPFDGPIGATFVFHVRMPANWPAWRRMFYEGKPCIVKRRYDLENLVKGILDALTGTFYADDSQVFELALRREWANDEQGPGVDVEIRAYRAQPGLRAEALREKQK